ncbi:hypothetical protein, conserved [Eimeria brunetti]|uniref:Uncharacterized protein n=1 Tax=Eimeria brunetti TaxID=51314 RepID=U6LQA4_9EIME|nr:hypothetical protein, conserved [Eimeria brunetti]
MHRGSCLEPSAPSSVEAPHSYCLPREFLGDDVEGLGAAKRTRRGLRPGRGPSGDGAPAKRLRGPRDDDFASVAASEEKHASDATGRSGDGEDERWRLLEQLSQAIPAAGTLLPEGPPQSSQHRETPQPAASEVLDWEACNRALDRLVRANKPQNNLSVEWDSGPSSHSRDVGLFELPIEGNTDFHDDSGSHLHDHTGHMASLFGDAIEGTSLFVAKGELGAKRTTSNAADPMKERQRRELQHKKTLDLASQIASRFRVARRPGVIQLLHRFFSCSSRQVRDPHELEKLVGACCYIIARQQGDDMTLNDVTAQLERRQGSKGRQRCRCISRWVVKVCGKLQLRCLPRHGDAEMLASNALRRICCHLKLLLTQQEQQELLLLQSLKEAYRQCLQQEADAGPADDKTSQQQKDGALAELDDEDLLGLLLRQQQEEAAANAPASVESGLGSPEGDLTDVNAFLTQFDSDCNAKKTQIEDEVWARPAATAESVVSLGPDGSLQLSVSSEQKAGNARSRLSEWDSVATPEARLLSGEAADPAVLDAQIQQHECVLRLLRLLPSAQRIKLDHSIWLQKQRKLALQQLREQSSLVIKCVGLLQQLTNVAFAAAAKRGCLPAHSAVSEACSTEDIEALEMSHAEARATDLHQGIPVEGEDPLDERWRVCGRCDAITTAAHFVIVFECLQVPVFQRVVLEALEVDRRSVYNRRREQLHLALSIFRGLPDAGDVAVKTLGRLLMSAANDPEMTSELLRIAETVPLRAPPGEGLDSPSEERPGTSFRTSGHLSSQTVSRCSAEDLSSRSSCNQRGQSPTGLPSPAVPSRSPASLGDPVNPKDLCDAETINSTAAAAALRELEEGDPVLSETPMARVVSLQYERTQQRWVCKWREGLGTGGRWHRRCFSVVKYGEDGAHALAAAVAKKLRDRRSQEVNGLKNGSTATSDVSPLAGDVTPNGGASKRGSKSAMLSETPASNPRLGGSGCRARNRRNATTARATAAPAGAPTSRDPASSYSFSHVGDGKDDSVLANIPSDPNLSTVMASAAYSDEMERLAQLLRKARSNPLLAKWLDERAPPPGAAALRAAAESIVPYLALQAEADKAPAGTSVSFRQQPQPLHRRGRVTGAREGM